MPKLSKLLAALPAILLMVFMNMFITSVVAGTVMVELLAAYPGSRWPLGAAILTAVIVYGWLVFSHKLRTYIAKLGATNE